MWIVAVALTVRLAVVLWSLNGSMIVPQVSLSERYFQEGYAIVAGWGYVAGDGPLAALTPAQRAVERGERDPGTDVPRPASFYPETLHPPGMSLLVAALHRTFGGDANLAMMLVGALLDTAAAVILYALVCAAWSEGVAFAAALTYAAFVPQAYAATADRLPNGLTSFFVIATFACAMRGVAAVGRARWGWFALAGLICGLGGYMRPDYDLLALWLVPFLWLAMRGLRPAATCAALMLAVTIATLVPWAYRNHRIDGRWTFTSSAVGSTLVEGLGEFANPWGIGYSDAWLAREAQAHGFASAWTLDADAYFSELFARDVRAHPLAYVATLIKRVPLVVAPAHLFGFVNPRKTQTFTQARAAGLDRYAAIVRHPGYVVAAYWDALIFSAIGLLFLGCSVAMLWIERERFATVALLMAPHAYGIATHLLSDAEPRYLLPSTFSLMIGFGYAVVALRSRQRAASVRTVPARA